MGKKSTKSTTTTTLPAWAQSLGQGAGNQILNTVSGNQGNLNQLAGDIRGQLPGLANMAFGEQPVQAGINYANDVLGGKYLNGNPQTEAMAKLGEQNALNAVNSSFSMAGRTGGGNNIERAAQGVANAGNQIRFGQYNQERSNQQQAAGMLPAMNAAQYTGVSPYLAAAQTAGQLPYSGIGNLGQIGGLYGGSGSTTGTQPGGWGTALLGAGMSALPFIFSDRRLKKDIVEVGTHRSGLTEYEWTYRNDPEAKRYRGVMADEVKLKRPEAYVENYLDTGFDAVNYGAL